ncbi:hypothetical protein AC067_08110 [Escherichia coli]|nr:hypothetical protein AC067_08110 [Escherichia coli]
MYKVCLIFFVSGNLQRKIAETASDKTSQGILVTTESIGWATKKVPGLLLNLLNDTN